MGDGEILGYSTFYHNFSFSEALKIRGHDGPTNKLFKYMKDRDFVAPETWKNYRELTSK